MAPNAYERGLEALGRREHSSAELAGWLTDRGHSPAEATGAVARLAETGAIDDERFAREFAADKRELRGWGPDRIREALAERGLDSALIDAVLVADGHDQQFERAVALLERRGEIPNDERSRARALGHLARRGYDSELAYEAVRELERRGR